MLYKKIYEPSNIIKCICFDFTTSSLDVKYGLTGVKCRGRWAGCLVDRVGRLAGGQVGPLGYNEWELPAPAATAPASISNVSSSSSEKGGRHAKCK